MTQTLPTTVDVRADWHSAGLQLDRSAMTLRAYSSGGDIAVTSFNREQWGRRRRGERVRDAVQRLAVDLLNAERATGREHARRVAQCFLTPPSQVHPGPAGPGIGAWADQPLAVTVREDTRGQYHVSVWTLTDTSD